MTTAVARKWRPTLAMITFAVLATVLALPLVGLLSFRVYESQLVRETEAELIAQSAVLAALFALEAEALPDPPPGRELAATPSGPIAPSLDLARDEPLPPRPDALPAPAPPRADLLALGAGLQAVALRAQSVTLAGFRILDGNGVVVAGRAELGLSLAHLPEVAAALAGHYRASLRERTADEPPPPLGSLSRGAELRVFTAMPVIARDRVAGVVYASRTPTDMTRRAYAERRRLAWAGLTVLAATLVIGLVFWRAITRPIHALVARSIAIGRGDRDAIAPLARHGTRERALLSQSFLDMAQRLHERSDQVATFAAHVSHELKSPLTAIKGAAELMRDGAMTEAERHRFLDNIIADTDRLARMLHRLRELARAEAPPTAGRTRPTPVLAQLRAAFPDLRIEVLGSLDPAVGIAPDNLLIVLSHLADNAVRHGARRITIEASLEAARVRILVADDGEGIAARNRERVFDPFFTTRRASGGTGMGLGIAQAMLRAHGGTIALLPSERGATFALELPATDARQPDS